MTSRSTGEMGRKEGEGGWSDGVRDTLQLWEGYVAAFTDLYLFVRLPPPAGEILILPCRIIGLAHPKDVVTERREIKIYRRATPARQSPSTIPGDVDQPTGFGLFARWQPIVKTRNPGFLLFPSF